MAKLSSKYFASVITKLLAAKRRENIIIDEQFKSDLRANLMVRAGNMDTAPEGGSVVAFLSRWRYALALVPSAMLLMLVISQFMKMPVEIESDVMVPTGGGSEVLEEDSDSSSDDLTPGVQGTPGVFEEIDKASDTSDRKIKTFSGAEILEQYKKDLQTDVLSGTGVVESEVSVTKSTGEVVKYVPRYEIDERLTTEESGGYNDETGAVSTAGVMVTPTPSSSPMPYYYNYIDEAQNEGPVKGNDVRVTNTSSKKDYSEDLTGDADVEDEETDASQDADSTPTEGMGGGADTGTGDSVGESTDTNDEVSEDETVPYSTTLDPVVLDNSSVLLPQLEVQVEVPQVEKPSITDNLVPASGDISNVNPGTVPPPAQEVLPIHYLVDLSPETKKDLETEVILPTVKSGGNIVAVNVSSREQGVLSVETCYVGSGCSVKHYLKNPSTGVWDNVQFVTRTFTQGPSYTTRLQYSPRY